LRTHVVVKGSLPSLASRALDGACGVADWLRRAAELVPLRDRIVFVSPPILAEKFLRYALSSHKRDAAADDPGARDPALVALLLDLFRAAGKHYFGLRVTGVEHVPKNGPVLLVGNHNGALLPTDGFFAALAIFDRFGPTRAVYALAHDFLFWDPTLRRYALRLGGLRASHESARRAFAQGGIVLVYPGSDVDTFRSWGKRDRIELGGRTGFLTLAIRAGVPIVPVVSVGTHEQLVVLTRGDRLAKLLHTHAWARTDVFPIVLSFPWGITTGFLPYFPLPAQTSLAFGAPIAWPELKSTDAEDPVVLSRCYSEVESKMQALLDGLSAGRVPIVGDRFTRRRSPADGTARAPR
jgi:1-acyl-sn-glycerol-3-phosphate acyltransferase